MPPVLAIIGKKNSGKTTLIEKLIPELIALGLLVGTIKHHHGAISMDQPGKDTWRHKQAGAHTVLLSSPTGLGIIRDTPGEIPLFELVDRYFSDVDLVLAEGYKKEPLPKIEIFRSTVHADPLSDPGEDLLAIMSDVAVARDIPCFALSETRQLAEFLVARALKGH
jgi:molybdopterin-guanine dinucleotide biosynthesis adapter protein